MIPTPELPHDAAFPGLAAIHQLGLARTVPALGLRGRVDLLLRGYASGKRATLEARCGDRSVAIKLCAGDIAPEARLYQELSARGLAPPPDSECVSAARVPRLLAWDRRLRLLALGWLHGPTLNQLIKEGQGERAGELASRWFRRAASLSVILGPTYGPASVLDRAPTWVGKLAETDAVLGDEAAKLLRELARTLPPPGSPGLVHGTLYARHIIDTGGGPGLIDWDGFGHGPLEFDAGVFLATVWRIRLTESGVERAVAHAEQAFLAGTAGRLDPRALAWYRAGALLNIARRLETRAKRNWKARALALLLEAGRSAITVAA